MSNWDNRLSRCQRARSCCCNWQQASVTASAQHLIIQVARLFRSASNFDLFLTQVLLIDYRNNSTECNCGYSRQPPTRDSGNLKVGSSLMTVHRYSLSFLFYCSSILLLILAAFISFICLLRLSFRALKHKLIETLLQTNVRSQLSVCVYHLNLLSSYMSQTLSRRGALHSAYLYFFFCIFKLKFTLNKLICEVVDIRWLRIIGHQ